MATDQSAIQQLLQSQTGVQTTGQMYVPTAVNNGNPNTAYNQPRSTEWGGPDPDLARVNNTVQNILPKWTPPAGGSTSSTMTNLLGWWNGQGGGTGGSGGGTGGPTTPGTPGPAPGGGGGSGGGTAPRPNQNAGTGQTPNYQLNNNNWQSILQSMNNGGSQPRGSLDLSNLTQGSFGQDFEWGTLNDFAAASGLGNFKMEDGSFDWRQLLDAVTEPFIRGDFWNSETKEWTIPKGLAGMLGGPMGEYVYQRAADALEKQVEMEGPDLTASTNERIAALRNEFDTKFMMDTNSRLDRGTQQRLNTIGLSREDMLTLAQRAGWTAGMNPEQMTQRDWERLLDRVEVFRSGLSGAGRWGTGIGSGISGTGSYDAPTVDALLRNFTRADGGPAGMTPQEWEAMMRARRGEVTR